MIIYFVTTQPEICQIFKEKISNHKCFIYSELENIFDLIINKNCVPDILIADYSLFNHDLFIPIRQLIDSSIKTPLIYYNDPTVLKSDRITHWIFQNKSKENILNFDEIFELLCNLVESPDLIPYIKLMQKPKPIPQKMLTDYLYKDFLMENISRDLYHYRKLPGMTDGLFLILETLFINQETPMSLETIQFKLAESNKYLKIESLNVELSRLRSILKKDTERRIEILNRKKTYQLVQY